MSDSAENTRSENLSEAHPAHPPHPPRVDCLASKDLHLSFGTQNSRGFSRLRGTLVWNSDECQSRDLPIRLYRFLKETIPVVSSCIWTWSRLASAPARYRLPAELDQAASKAPRETLERMSRRLFPFQFRRNGGIPALMPLMFDGLFTDGAFGGIVEFAADHSRIERFAPLDVSRIRSRPGKQSSRILVYESDEGTISLDRQDFHYFGINTDPVSGLGRSILASIPFVTFVEQQLVDDMRRSSHNSGFHRLHVKVRPPERQPGETDMEYQERANDYFDQTTRMIRQTDVDDNPVTWDDIAIEYIGPKRGRSDAESWFVNHRAMIEEVCAGTNLAPFLLGYSFGATETWTAFKYDLVMRQVATVQQEAARFMEWLGNIELALAGFDLTCKFEFDNRVNHQLSQTTQAQSCQVESIVRLFEAGLLDKESASAEARKLFVQ